MSFRLFKFTMKRRWLMLQLLLKNNGLERGKLIRKAAVFQSCGNNLWYEPIKLPAEPQLVSIGDNVCITSDVSIINHDIMFYLINNLNGYKSVKMRRGGG